MKRSTLGKIIGTLGLAGALTLLTPKKADSLENIVNGQGRLNGSVIETINETPVKQGVELKLKEYLGKDSNGNEIIGDDLGSCQTDSNGNFSLDIDTSSSFLKVLIAHPDSSYYWAVRYLDLEGSNSNFDIIGRHDVDVCNLETESIEKMDFMEFFNSWFRSMNGCTQRWANEDEGGKGLKVFIKTPLATQAQIDSVYSKIQNIWPIFTKRVGKEPLIQNTYIEQGEEIPDYAKFGTDGWALVKWRNEGDPFHVEELDGNRIYSAAAILTPVADNRAITEELLQILGARTGIPDRFFWDINGNILESGWRCGKVVCSRPIGSKTPDIDPASNAEVKRYNQVNVEERINEFYISNAYPNPFNSSTTIEYQLPERTNVGLVIYDILGRKIKTLENSEKNSGSYKAVWDGRDEQGNLVGNGVYLYQLRTEEYNKTGKLMLVK